MLVLEVAAGVVLGVLTLFALWFLVAWVANWSERTKLSAVAVIVFGVVYGCNHYDEKRNSPSANTPVQTRVEFAARYKKDNPGTVNEPDEELVRRVLREYPAWCPKVEGGCDLR